MVVVKGGGETYTIGSGKYIASEADLPAWFTQHQNLLVTDGAGNARCVEMRDRAQHCMGTQGSYERCQSLVEAYHSCQAEALMRNRLPAKETDRMVELRAEMAKHAVEAEAQAAALRQRTQPGAASAAGGGARG